MAEFLTALSNAGNFTRDDFALVYSAKNKDATESSCRFVLQKLLDSGSIARVGRNNYCVNDKTSRKYTHEYLCELCVAYFCISVILPQFFLVQPLYFR